MNKGDESLLVDAAQNSASK